jgi:hypothetical protein
LGTLDHADTQAGIENEDYGFYPRFYPEGDANDLSMAVLERRSCSI